MSSVNPVSHPRHHKASAWRIAEILPSLTLLLHGLNCHPTVYDVSGEKGQRMKKTSLKFLTDLLNSPSPSGYERPIQDVVRRYAGEFADDVSTDWHGNVVAAVNPDGYPRIMLAGHCDQIGLMVKHIDDNGFLRVTAIGGWDIQMLLVQRVQVWTASGSVPGVIARKAIHLLTADERKQVPELKKLWVDIGAADRAEAAELVKLGDPITLQLGFQQLRNNLAFAPGMDNRVGGDERRPAYFCQESPRRGVRRLDGAGGDWSAWSENKRLCHRSTTGNCRRRDARDRLSDRVRGGAWPRRFGRRAGRFSRPEHQSRDLQQTRGTGEAVRHSLSDQRHLETGRQ